MDAPFINLLIWGTCPTFPTIFLLCFFIFSTLIKCFPFSTALHSKVIGIETAPTLWSKPVNNTISG